MASWYGADFHGKSTSNGEVYDMHAMTAAHKTLPLGVWLRVTNRDNGRSCTVRVNDRGPFVKSRILDLSFAAAKDLGVVGPGTAPVRIEALGYRETDARGNVAWRQPKSYTVDSYAVQIGSFAIRDNADRLAAQMRTRLGAAAVQEGWVGGQRFYRVRVGDYRTIEAAETARAGFEQGGYANSFVVAMDQGD
jgi:rare lipoprotein A